MNVFGIYRRLFAKDDGILHELWDDKRAAITRKDALSSEQSQYHWYMCELQVRSASKRAESRPTVRPKRAVQHITNVKDSKGAIMYLGALNGTGKKSRQGIRHARTHTRVDHDVWRSYEVEKQRLRRLSISPDEYECMVQKIARSLGV
jgi:hypothetical protein